MKLLRRRLLATVFVAFAGAAVASVAVLAAPSTTRTTPAKATVITVTAGKPSELAFKLSRSSAITAGVVTFRITNRGKLSHDFKLCTAPAKSAAKNSCVGKVTPPLAPGRSASLTVTLKKGEYEFLCAVPGHALQGMKGLLAVGEKLVIPKAGGGTTTTTTAPATTTPRTGSSTAPVFPTGTAANGRPLFVSNCGSCHHLSAAGTTGAIELDGTSVTVSFVDNQAYNGGDGMPPFQGVLSVQQIADIAAFVAANAN